MPLTLSEKLFYAKIKEYHRNGQECFASNNFFAKYFGISVPTIKRLLRSLQEKGYVEIEGYTKARRINLAQNDPSIPNLVQNCPKQLGTKLSSTRIKIVPNLDQNDPSHINNKGIININTIEPGEENPQGDSYSPEFEEFWGIYPRKQSKSLAYKKWKARIKEKVSADILIGCCKRFATSMEKERRERQHIMKADRFLGPNEEWKDYLTITIQSEKCCPECGSTDGLHYAGCKRGGLKYD